MSNALAHAHAHAHAYLPLQISFFAGFMALDARREALRKTDCCPCCCSAPLPEEVRYS